jgi:hypothetical protein
MSKRTRRNHSAAFKAKVALAAIKSLPRRRPGASRRWRSWRSCTRCIRRRSRPGRRSCLRVPRGYLGPVARPRKRRRQWT